MVGCAAATLVAAAFLPDRARIDLGTEFTNAR